MPPNKLSTLFNLPFIKTYNGPNRNFITSSKIQTFLGFNFYSRLNSIYTNLVEAIGKKNYRYIGTSFQSGLASQIMGEMKSIQQGQFKLRIQTPTKLTVPRKRKFFNMLPVRQSIWDNGVTRIGIQCNVYFGERFDREDPLKKNQQRSSRLYRVGQFRYLCYYNDLGLIENIKNWYKQQAYELFVRYSSKTFLQIQNFDDISSKSSFKQNQQLITQVVFMTGNQKFDWVIVDINQLNKARRLNIQKDINNNNNSNNNSITNIKENINENK